MKNMRLRFSLIVLLNFQVDFSLHQTFNRKKMPAVMEYSIQPTPAHFKTSGNTNEYKKMLFNLRNTLK